MNTISKMQPCPNCGEMLAPNLVKRIKDTADVAYSCPKKA